MLLLLSPQIASYLNRLTSDLEAAAYPALDSLTSRVTAHNLERVRRIKSRLVRLTTRVENVSRAAILGAYATCMPWRLSHVGMAVCSIAEEQSMKSLSGVYSCIAP